ncbi:unnamed protein product [Vicia faba]|uniref:NB-ARC domain-containing protein n=1 Tax=Vicia faba TaxID=3906 RepID=A0AAV1AFN2_VICFA|nr:unnamed protein product [Vicia faba]
MAEQIVSGVAENLINRLKDDVLHPSEDLLDDFLIQNMRHKIDESHKNKLTQDYKLVEPITWKPKYLCACYCWDWWFGDSCSVGKKYLLVLDDIWNESFEKWARLRTYLMCGAQDNMVLVTTRSKVVAQTMGVSVPYTLDILNPIASWSLLKKIITYGDETKGIDQILEPIDEDSIMPVLKLSYQNLSPQLRKCFSYCSLYPKDWEIEKDELIQLWKAQGHLGFSDENQTMEEIGNQFVKIFLMKSFFQVAQYDEAFPVWICNLLSLEYIYIGECQVLASLPDEMLRLTKLQTLEIIGCPLLIDGLLHVVISVLSGFFHIAIARPFECVKDICDDKEL